MAEQTGLSRPTVDAVLTALAESGPVRVVAAAPSTAPGRPARRFTFAPEAATVAAVDIGDRSVRCLLTDAAGRMVATGRREYAGNGAAARLDAVAQVVQDAADEGGTDERLSPAVVGIAVPGILDAAGRLAQSLAVRDLEGMDIAAELSSLLDCPVAVENDIKLAGELGTQRGMRWTSTSRRGRLSWSTGDDAAPLFARAADGDQAALAGIDAFCAEIAPRLATLLLTVDPEQVVIGGGLSRAGDLLLAPLRHHVHHLLTSPGKPVFRTARLTTDGALVGALGLAFEQGSVQVNGVPEVPPPWHRFPAPPDHPRPADARPEGTP